MVKKATAKRAPAVAPVTAGVPAPRSSKENHVIGEAAEFMIKWTRQHPWQLAPLVALVLVFAAAQADGPVVSATLTSFLAVSMYASQKWKVKIAGRMFLSERERLVASKWLAIAAVWSLLSLFPVPVWAEALCLVFALAWPTQQWLACRKPARRKKLSSVAKERLDIWRTKVATLGPDPLKGSHPLLRTVAEPSEGTLVFHVQLREDVHGSNAASDTCRKSVESLTGLPSDCVQIEKVRDSSTQIKVTMSPSRRLEADVVTWPGPEINPDGTMPIGEAPDGSLVNVRTYDDSGVLHCRISGKSNGGKSGSGRVVIFPGVIAGWETVWLIDGKRGTSMPELAPLFDWYSIRDAEWGQVIDSAYDVMVARQIRRGAAGRSFYRVGEEDDPVICLYIEEASEVTRVIGTSRRAKGDFTRAEKVLSILQNGRALGIRVVQVAQDSMYKNLLGGREARDLMSLGFNIMHRPGGSMAGRLAKEGGSDQESVDLTALPGKAGFAAVQQGGDLIAPVCRIRYVTNEQAQDVAATVTARTLKGADLTAAGATYANRGVEVPIVELAPVVSAVETPVSTEEPELDEQEVSTVQKWIIKKLYNNTFSLGDLEALGKGRYGCGRKNLSNNLARMREAGVVAQDEKSKKYSLARSIEDLLP